MSSTFDLLQHALIPLDMPPELPGWNRARIASWQGAEVTRRAAVLIAIREDPGAHVIFTRRQDHLTDHAGQVAFPGGGVDASDINIVDTALRESEEEVMLNRHWVEPLGYLDCFETISGFAVTPVVARVKTGVADLKANQDEVADVFEVPLAFFMDRDNLLAHNLTYHGSTRRMVEFHYDHFRIWGATAGILLNLLDRMGQTWTHAYL